MVCVYCNRSNPKSTLEGGIGIFGPPTVRTTSFEIPNVERSLVFINPLVSLIASFIFLNTFKFTKSSANLIASTEPTNSSVIPVPPISVLPVGASFCLLIFSSINLLSSSANFLILSNSLSNCFLDNFLPLTLNLVLGTNLNAFDPAFANPPTPKNTVAIPPLIKADLFIFASKIG